MLQSKPLEALPSEGTTVSEMAFHFPSEDLSSPLRSLLETASWYRSAAIVLSFLCLKGKSRGGDAKAKERVL
uniref:Uncharacterized protein n=1 Tax=Rhizophora mucronata TaxID=61149 RepID=A0A2P2NLR7_RHIMU